MTSRKEHVGKTPQEKAAYGKMLRNPMNLDPTFEEDKIDKTNTLAPEKIVTPPQERRKPYKKKTSIQKEKYSWFKANIINLIICIVAAIICLFIINVNRDVGVIDQKINNVGTNVSNIQININSIERDVIIIKTNIETIQKVN